MLSSAAPLAVPTTGVAAGEPTVFAVDTPPHNLKQLTVWSCASNAACRHGVVGLVRRTNEWVQRERRDSEVC